MSDTIQLLDELRAGDPRAISRAAVLIESLIDETITRPRRVTLCGSSRFVDIMAVCAWLIERDERAIAMGLHLLPHWYPNCPEHHLAEHEGVSAAMDALHLHKIAISDEIFVVNVNDYIGSSTAAEIAHAEKLGKKIRRYTTDKIGRQVAAMLAKPR